MTFIVIIFLILFILLMSMSISNKNWNVLRIYKKQSSRRKILILCIIGYLICVTLSASFASVILQPEFGQTMSMIYSFLAGVGIYLFWFLQYKKRVNKNQNQMIN